MSMQNESGIFVRVGWGEIYAMVASQGMSYAPDAVHDMANRAKEMLNEAMTLGKKHGLIESEPLDTPCECDEDCEGDCDCPACDIETEEEAEVNDVGFWFQ